jgi:hypothetical protein
MPEWWTYSLADFLLFSPRTYYRLIERHNDAVWPAHLATLGLGVLIAVLMRKGAWWRGRVVSGIVAVLWAWVAGAFVWGRYATINWGAAYLVWLLAVEVALLVWAGVVRGGLSFRWRADATGVFGGGLFLLCLAGYPMFAPLGGRGWAQVEVFGIAPDPTVMATLGLLLLVEGGPRWSLQVAPVLWCLVAGATLMAMGSPEAWIVLSATLLSVVAAIARGRRSP